MNSMWLSIKIWSKVVIVTLLAICVLVFVLYNLNKPVTIWLWNDRPTTLLSVVFYTWVLSVLGTLLVWTTYKTLRQFRDMRHRSRTDRLEREMADMKTKAAMLQTRPASPPPPATEQTPPSET